MNALSVLFGILLFLTALFLILLVLVQRGRGGGLSGALGGMGGQSAFGTKAGDLFTRITMVVATVWILLCLAAILLMNPQRSRATDASREGREFTRRSTDSSPAPASPTGTPGTKANTEAGPAEASPAPAPAPGGAK
jgi:preprotein translocase subunit SecG